MTESTPGDQPWSHEVIAHWAEQGIFHRGELVAKVLSPDGFESADKARSTAIQMVMMLNEYARLKGTPDHLIAAAPDLLEALEDMLDLFGYYHGPRMDKAIATVAKAKGQTP